MPLSAALAEIDLAAMVNNLNRARLASPESKIMAVVKAEAYGHGLVPVTTYLERLGGASAGVDAFGVARMDEAVAMRESAIETPITLLQGILDTGELEVARRHQLDLVVHSEYQLEALAGEATMRLWLKLETGMHRLGLPVSRLDETLQRVRGHKILGLMGHLANADNRDVQAIQSQLRVFQNAVGLLPYDKSLASSAGLLGHPRTRAEWNRPGLMLYGATPFADLEPMSSLQPVMTLSAPVIAINRIRRGDTVGYGSIWTATSDCRVAVVAIGYGDGYPREAPMNTLVLVNGKRRALAGRVSMDMLTIELSEDDQVTVGDRVVLWGKGLPIEELARCTGTIPYTLMCGVTQRVQRDYLS